MNLPSLLIPAALLGAFAASARAQAPASYTPFGEGCNGGTVANCLSLNDANPTLLVASLPNEYAYPVLNTTNAPIQIVGFEIYTQTNTSLTETVNTGVIHDAGGPAATTHSTPDLVNAASGTITVGAAQGWYSTSVYPPITIQPGAAFWLHVDAYGRVAPPQHTAGGVNGPVANYWRRPNYLNYTWVASGSVVRPIYRIHCLPATPTVPSILATSLPRFGQPFGLQVRGGQPFLPSFVIWAFDRTQWLSLPTPVDLTPFGAPTCFNRTSTDITALLLLDANGQGATGFTVPTDPSFGGFTWYNQAAVLAPGVNVIDLLVSNAGTAVVGN